MDAILHQVGKELLLTQRKELHAARRLQHLPQLLTRNQTSQPHGRPAVNSNTESPGFFGILHIMQAHYTDALVQHNHVHHTTVCQQLPATSCPLAFVNDCELGSTYDILLSRRRPLLQVVQAGTPE